MVASLLVPALAKSMPEVAKAALGGGSGMPQAVQQRITSNPIQQPYTNIDLGGFGDFNLGSTTGGGSTIVLLLAGVAIGGVVIWALR